MVEEAVNSGRGIGIPWVGHQASSPDDEPRVFSRPFTASRERVVESSSPIRRSALLHPGDAHRGYSVPLLLLGTGANSDRLNLAPSR
jgi:hypothetical protein